MKKVNERQKFFTEQFIQLFHDFEDMGEATTPLVAGGKKYQITDVVDKHLDYLELHTAAFYLEINGGDKVVLLELNATQPLIEFTLWADTRIGYVLPDAEDAGDAQLRLTYRLPETGDESTFLEIKDKTFEIDYPTPEMVQVLVYFVNKVLTCLQVTPTKPFLWASLQNYVKKQHSIYEAVKKMRGKMRDAWDELQKDWADIEAVSD